MRFLRIFLLHFELIAEHRSRSFVYFIMSFLNPLVLLLFWKGALAQNSGTIAGWQLSTVTTYYFLLTVAGALLMSHIEEDIGEHDIQQGELVKYLLRPVSYYWMKFAEEIHYRVLQGAYGILTCLLLIFVFGPFFVLTSSPFILLLSIICTILAYFLAFNFKMIIGLLSFWIIENRGILQLTEIFMIIFAGYVMPLQLMPSWLQTLTHILPFAYMIYFPIAAFQGNLAFAELLVVIVKQIIWLIIFYSIYQILWIKGIKKFTAVGQ